MHTGSDMRRVNECLSKLRNSHSERIMKLKKTLFRSTKHITGSNEMSANPDIMFNK